MTCHGFLPHLQSLSTSAGLAYRWLVEECDRHTAGAGVQGLRHMAMAMYCVGHLGDARDC